MKHDKFHYVLKQLVFKVYVKLLMITDTKCIEVEIYLKRCFIVYLTY